MKSMKTWAALVGLLGLALAGCGVPDITQTCTMKGTGDGQCDFANRGTGDGSVDVKIVVHSKESDDVLTTKLFSGIVKAGDARTRKFTAVGLGGFCRSRKQPAPWTEVCSFEVVQSREP